MSTNELNSHLNSFQQPGDFGDQAWQHLLSQSRKVWDHYLNGKDWKESLNIPCKEAYLMLVDSEGKLIVKDDTLLNYVKNAHVKSWIKRVEEIAYKSIRDKRYDVAERYFGKLIKLDKANPMHYYRRATIRVQSLNHKAALEDLSMAIQLNNRVASFYAKRAEVYRLLDVDHKAMSDMNAAIKLNPSMAKYYDTRGKFRISLGDRAGGRLDLVRAEELSRGNDDNIAMQEAA